MTPDEISQQDKPKSFLEGLAEPTLIIGLIAVILYGVIITYYISFFDNLSVPYSSVTFTPSSFVYTLGSFLIILIVIIYMGVFLLTFPTELKYSRYLVFSIAFLLMVFFAYKLIFLNLIMSICAVIIVLGLIIVSPRLELKNIYYGKSSITSVRFIAISMGAIISIYALIIAGGHIASNELVKGHQGYEIEFIPLNNSTELLNKTFMFIIYSDNRYYVVERDLNPESRPKKLHIIKDNQIKSATIKKIVRWYPNLRQDFKSILHDPLKAILHDPTTLW